MAAALKIQRLANSIGRKSLVARSTAARCGSARRASAVVVTNAQRSKDSLPVAAVGVALSTGLGGGAAYAQDTAAVDSAVGSIVDIVKAAGDAVKAGLGAAQQGVEAAREAYTHVAPAVQSALDAAAPVVKQAVKAATPAVEAGVRAAGSAVSEAKPGLEHALESTGVDPGVVAGAEAAAEKAATAVRPVFESLLDFVTTSSPATLAECALGLAAAYYVLPAALRFGAAAARGYKGDVSPAAALDALSTQGGAVLLDIRTSREKEAAGVPDLGANSGKLVELEFASIQDRRVREKLRGAGDLEVKITAMQAAALKRVSSGTPVYIIDRQGSTAKAVAKELARRGFGSVFVVNGGFQGWVRDRLGSKLAPAVSRVEVLLPGSVGYGAGSSRQVAGTARTARQLPQQAGTSRAVRQLPAPRRALPSGAEQ